MLGDNMYRGQSPQDFVQKFEKPYAELLAAGVKFQASLGNHDRPENVSYKFYNMGGQRYYTYARNNVRFFVIDSTHGGSKAAGVARGSPCATRRRTGRSLTSITRSIPTRARHGASGRPPRPAGAALHELRRERRLLRPRSRHASASSRRKASTTSCPARRGQLRKGNMRPDDGTAADCSIGTRASCSSRWRG